MVNDPTHPSIPMLNIGSAIRIPPFVQAGLAGYSDRPMRIVARRRGCPYAVTEAILDSHLVGCGREALESVRVRDDDHPIAGQIIGSNPKSMAQAARMLVVLGHDVIDVNLACPVRKLDRIRGGHLLAEPELAIGILTAVRAAVPDKVPTTVKMRRSWDDSPRSVEQFEQILEAAWKLGYAAVCVHGRTVAQKYLGLANRAVLVSIKRRYPDRTILGSGDIFFPEDAWAMVSEAGMDGAWIARGAIGNPWIFQQSIGGPSSGSRDAASLELQVNVGGTLSGALQQRVPWAPTIHMQREAIQEHLSLAIETYGMGAAKRVRGSFLRYSRAHPRGDRVRCEMLVARTIQDHQSVMDVWYAHDGPGVPLEPRVIDEVNGCSVCDPAGAFVKRLPSENLRWNLV